MGHQYAGRVGLLSAYVCIGGRNWVIGLPMLSKLRNLWMARMKIKVKRTTYLFLDMYFSINLYFLQIFCYTNKAPWDVKTTNNKVVVN